MPKKLIVDSPCTGQCTFAIATDLCVGCYRTMSEIRAWANMTKEERQQVYNELSNRKSLTKRR